MFDRRPVLKLSLRWPRDVRVFGARPYPVGVSEPLQALPDDVSRGLATTSEQAAT